MADIKLGPLGSETPLPAVCWPQGGAPNIPYDVEKSIDEAQMLDGSVKFNIRTHSAGTFSLDWDGITWTEVEAILAKAVLNEKLSYVNEWTDNISHEVVVRSYGHALKGATAARTPRYLFSLTLKETKAP